MESILIGMLVVMAAMIIGLVLLQHGKGADIGAAFGSGASSTVFGSQGSASFLVKLTFALAAIFFIVCIALTSLTSHSIKAAANITVPHSTKQLSLQTGLASTTDNKVPKFPLTAKADKK